MPEESTTEMWGYANGGCHVNTESILSGRFGGRHTTSGAAILMT